MRICVHTIWDVNAGYIGGTERFVLALTKELRLLGFDAFVVCTGRNKIGELEGVPIVYRLPSGYDACFEKYGEAKGEFFKEAFLLPNSDEVRLKRLANYVHSQISDIDIDVLHLNSFTTAVFLDSSMKTIATQHENNFETDNIWGLGFFDKFMRYIKEKSPPGMSRTLLAAPSSYYARLYAEKIGRDVVEAKQGIVLADFPTRKRKRWQHGDTLKLLLPSRFEPTQKGHDIALQAVMILKGEGIDVKLTFTGARNDTLGNVEEIRSIYKSYGLEENICIKVFSNMNKAYDETDVVISPERYCSYGLSISEALSKGVPTALSDIPTYREIAQPYQHAFFFKVDDAHELSLQIKAAAMSSHDCLTRNEIQFRIDNDIRKCAEQYANLYMSGLGGRLG